MIRGFPQSWGGKSSRELRSRIPELAQRTYDLLLEGRPRVGINGECAQVYGELRAGLLDNGQVIGETIFGWRRERYATV